MVRKNSSNTKTQKTQQSFSGFNAKRQYKTYVHDDKFNYFTIESFS